MSTFSTHTVTEPQVEMVHMLRKMLSLAGLGEDSRSALRHCVQQEQRLQAAGNGIMKVIAVVLLQGNENSENAEEGSRGIARIS